MSETLSVEPEIAYQPEVLPLLERLQPYEVVDAAGFHRRVYVFGRQKLVLKGREELPEIPDFTDAVIAGAAETPRFSNEASRLGSDTSKIIVNQTPLGVVEAALYLGAKDTQLKTMQQELVAGTYSNDSFALIDSIMACRLIGPDGQVAERADPDAEALVLLALTGDTDAQQEMQKRQAALSRVSRTAQSNSSYHLSNQRCLTRIMSYWSAVPDMPPR